MKKKFIAATLIFVQSLPVLAGADEGPWTDWYHRWTTFGALYELGQMRDDLMDNNLHDPYVNYSGHAVVDCTKPAAIRFRSADGTCTDLEKPIVGAAGTAFGRNVPPQFIDNNAAQKLMAPNPALVSQTFFTRDEIKEVPFLNMLAASWIQFMNHDWLTHGENETENPHRIQKPDGSEALVDRTEENTLAQSQFSGQYSKITVNHATHWWDGGQIYGNNQAEQNELRAFQFGRMRTEIVNGREILPKNSALNVLDNRRNQGYEMTGFRDNWWVGLSMLHTLFVLEHNKIADLLFENHVQWSSSRQEYKFVNGKSISYMDEVELDEHIFQTARLVNSAIMAKIHTVEWTPAILANPTLKRGMYTNWYGILNPRTWGFSRPDTTDWFPAFKSGFVWTGIVGDKKDDSGTPFSITEEFTSVYRLHSLLPEALRLRRIENKAAINEVAMLEARNDKSYGLMAGYDLKDLYYSFGVQKPGQLVLNNFPKFMQELTVPGHRTMDLGMVDVLRDRERGVPRYNQFRRGIGLTAISSYRDFFPSDTPAEGSAEDLRRKAVIQKFRDVYGTDSEGKDNVEDIDLLVGTLAEEVRPTNFGFGETQFQIFILMASRRLMADRFFTDYYSKEYYTDTGIRYIDKEGTLAKVITRHMHELAPHLEGVETAFNPWNQ